MASIHLPSQGRDSWQWLLAQPGLHWKHGASAMALADAWERPGSDPWPPRVTEALEAGGLADLELLLALPEHQTPLPGGSTASQTDLLVLARSAGQGLVVIAVEGKAAEPFGDDTVAAWRAKDGGSPGREKRLAHLLEILGLHDDATTAGLRYQLLHRTASALIEARRFGAARAVMLVHSFHPDHLWFEEYAAFAEALGVDEPLIGAVLPTSNPSLSLGWAYDDVPADATPAGLGPRFDRALVEARVLHAGQFRKGTQIPYVAHLLGVASLVIEDGGDEDEAIAALLHDAVEDQGGAPTLKRIKHLFGTRVAAIVDACSDTDVIPKPPWRERKEAYVAHLAEADASTLRVSLADKLHNARAILFDLHAVGAGLWDRFNADRDDVLWYYRALSDAFLERYPGAMAEELARTVDAIGEL